MRNKLVLILCLMPVFSLAEKSENKTYVESASQFQRLCKKKSYFLFRKQQQQPYSWTASTHRKLNDYQTRGQWIVANKNRDVFCQIRIGKKTKTIKIEIQ
ncbi:MAG: hypothetical protein QM484_13045 [Woeseiaceae bacterium]